jgi:hypothetical protein
MPSRSTTTLERSALPPGAHNNHFCSPALRYGPAKSAFHPLKVLFVVSSRTAASPKCAHGAPRIHFRAFQVGFALARRSFFCSLKRCFVIAEGTFERSKVLSVPPAPLSTRSRSQDGEDSLRSKPEGYVRLPNAFSLNGAASSAGFSAFGTVLLTSSFVDSRCWACCCSLSLGCWPSARRCLRRHSKASRQFSSTGRSRTEIPS